MKRIRLPFLTLILCFTTIWHSVGSAGEFFTLFTSPGVQAIGYNGYDGSVTNLQAGDQLKFSDGKTFEVLRILGKGQTTLILETSDGKALRIPLRAGAFRYSKWNYIDFIDLYLAGYEGLKNLNLGLPEVFSSLSSEYIVLEKIKVRFTLDQFLNGKVQLSDAGRTECLRRLKHWVRNLWPLIKIGDFHEEQIIFDGKQWRLIDFSGTPQYAIDVFKKEGRIPEEPLFKRWELNGRYNSTSAFNKEKLTSLYDELNSIIVAERKRRMNSLDLQKCSHALSSVVSIPTL